jgi:hypothetical protein
LEWFQRLITLAENANQDARLIAATIVMKAYGEELETHQFDQDRLNERVEQGIQDALR